MLKKQHPISSPFDAFSTALDVVDGVDLSHKTAIVTGGYSGLGLETTRALCAAGADVIVPARDTLRAQEATKDLQRVECMHIDLSDATSIDEFANEVLATRKSIDLLINNAGVMATPLFRDAHGHEGQFSVNHLGHFRLTCALWPGLARRGARVISVSSRGHQISPVVFDDIDFRQRQYDKWLAYGQAKTANALFAVALDRRGANEGVRAYSLHPGQILTRLARHLSAEEVSGFDAYDNQGNPRIDPAAGLKTPQQGAATALWCATSSLLEGSGGLYCEDCNVAQIHEGEPGSPGVSQWAVDDEAAERLWNLSHEWTGNTLISLR
ncbi:SDR family NAD(P)-dependent oxidoreductase [Qipengyuania sp. GH25]|uniref:SDR family NAD(P)-dependent oxidoreductase n=1 Tax=Qipengyuania pacifica TaxID=2860199 RepID=A0ABS7JK88_9SPHN|nr:oxidoreductase [Qipengyuania aerophila]MBX7489815.1 SDR family NAD(P)-dependent oxidoreductase [Qipengyuania aerophila]